MGRKANNPPSLKAALIRSKNATIPLKMHNEKRSKIVRSLIVAFGIAGPFIIAVEPVTNRHVPDWLIILAVLSITVDCALIYSIFLDVRESGAMKPNAPLKSKHFTPIISALILFQVSLLLLSFGDLQNGLFNYSLIALPIGVGILFGQRALDSGVRPSLMRLTTLAVYSIPVLFLVLDPPQTAISKVAILSPLLFGLPALATWLARRVSCIS
jgi:hypothetical protein